MNIRSFRNNNGLVILICLIAIILIYSIDVMKLTYRMTGWNDFGETPVRVSQVQYFIADTPNIIGYPEPGGSTVSCATTVAYVNTDTGETYRCCDTGEKISCLARDFSSDIPVMNEECSKGLQEAFAIPAASYQLFGSCSDDGTSQLTVVQLGNDGHILWKFLDAGKLQIISSALRCIVGPILLLLASAIFVIVLRRKPSEPIRKLW